MIALAVLLGVLGLSSALLLVYGVNLLYLSWSALRIPRADAPSMFAGDEPLVCVQIPVYDERHVATRVIDAVAAFDWPRDRLEVQVLDDSDDDTVAIVAASVDAWRARGLRIAHIRRGTRDGYKAGALAHGLGLTAARFIAIFDADFRPEPAFLRSLMGAFADPAVGFVQARWTHLNARYSLFTALQALMVDFHFEVEQLVRPAHGFLTNFTGSAGVWRRAAIEEGGGWTARTLTEDLDLSYRAQLAGWRAVYREGVQVPQELPVDVNGYRGQQARWATGSFQTARALLPALLRSNLPGRVKFQAVLHLLAYLAPVLMLVQIACYPALLVLQAQGELYQWVRLPAFVNLISLAPAIGFCVAQRRLGHSWWRRAPAAAMWSFLGAGTSYTVLRALLRSARSGGAFVRTPKYRIERPGQEWRSSSYVRVLDSRTPQEALLGFALLGLVVATAAAGWWLLSLYSLLFAGGFLALAGVSAYQSVEILAFRRHGLHALRTVQRVAPSLALFGAAAAGLALFLRLPDPFEDSYQHWLIAAHLAATGSLRDPIFSMQDTWLPGYQLAAAGILKAFGLWRLDLLKLASAACALVSLVLVYRLAPNSRQGRVAVLLLALNPVFLLVSTDAVAEPLLVVLLLAGALAGMRGRSAWAALFCLAACLVGTKAWIWVGAVGLVSVLPWLLQRRPRPGWAWAPALVAAGLLEVAFAPAAHSTARAAQEVASATARGSVPGSAGARLWELLSTFGLATLPQAALAVPGLRSVRADSPRVRWLFAPAAIYLGVVVLLVADGVYSGSHRYLYPALPALALLAAAALSRVPVPATVLAAGASAALVLGFIPLFQGFAAANSGLEAAGRAAASVPGALLTDSPVAAYFSHKPPDRIAGSAALPAGRDDALSWLRAHGYTSLVLERISYYPATSIFPDLSSGTAGVGFQALGDQRLYTVDGGKEVFAYRVLGGIELGPPPPEGKTAPLAKGAFLPALAGEGMGFGAPIVRFADGWWYPGTSTGGSARVFQLDMTGGDAAHGYRFVRTASRGAVAVTYHLTATGLQVTVRPLWLAAGVQQVAVLNEQSAAFDDFADPSRTLTGSAFGRWEPVAGGWARLQSRPAGLQWSLPALPGAQLVGGREVGPGLDWAGLDYLFGAGFTGAAYQITIQEAR